MVWGFWFGVEGLRGSRVLGSGFLVWSFRAFVV